MTATYQLNRKTTQTRAIERALPGNASVCLEDNRSPATAPCLQRNAITPGAVTQLAGVIGTHARVNQPASFVDPTGAIPAGNYAPNVARTTVTTDIIDVHGGVTNVTEGSTMVGFPITSHNCAGGSPTDATVRQVSQTATRLFGKRYIAGHLLNNHLGGPGDQLDNITAITAKSNSQHHVGIEKELKQDVLGGQFIAHYSVDCSQREAAVPHPGGPGVEQIRGLAKKMIARYSLLRVGGNPVVAGDYAPVRVLDLTLDPGGHAQTGIKDGMAMVTDPEVVQDRMESMFVTRPQSDHEFAALLAGVIGMGVPAAIAQIQALAGTGSISDMADRATVINNINELMRD